MSLIKCEECNKEISDQAKKCPNCGSPIKKSGCGYYVWLAVIAVVVLFFIGLGGQTDSADNPISPEITISLSSIHIKNADSFTWPSARVHINGIIRGFSYEHHSSIAPNQTLDIPLINFSKGNGERFQPLKTKATEVIVTVPGYDSPVFGF